MAGSIDAATAPESDLAAGAGSAPLQDGLVGDVIELLSTAGHEADANDLRDALAQRGTRGPRPLWSSARRSAARAL